MTDREGILPGLQVLVRLRGCELFQTQNPFRYRGYVYDTETGLYYLRSRYYNPSWGRFVNADEIISLSKTVCSHNLFGYCLNRPIVSNDEEGHSLRSALTATTITVALFQIVMTVLPSVAANIQLVVNRARAKQALSAVGHKQRDYLENVPYRGADAALMEGFIGKYVWLYGTRGRFSCPAFNQNFRLTLLADRGKNGTEEPSETAEKVPVWSKPQAP